MKLPISRTLCLLPFFAAAVSAENCVVNLSHYDEMNPNFTQMASSNILAVIHEATFPRFNQDVKYSARQTAATRAGLLWGAYHFADATDPARQADHFVDVTSSHWQRSPTQSGVLLVLDFEKNDHYPGGTMTVEQAATFVERIRQKTGRYPGVYASENRIKGIVNGAPSNAKSVLSRCWLWIANYHHEPKATSPWSSWSLWQYTGDGICDLPRSLYPIGIANIRKAERNIFAGSQSALRSFWASHAWVPQS